MVPFPDVPVFIVKRVAVRNARGRSEIILLALACFTLSDKRHVLTCNNPHTRTMIHLYIERSCDHWRIFTLGRYLH